jgi:hypothetical protein
LRELAAGSLIPSPLLAGLLPPVAYSGERELVSTYLPHQLS